MFGYNMYSWKFKALRYSTMQHKKERREIFSDETAASFTILIVSVVSFFVGLSINKSEIHFNNKNV